MSTLNIATQADYTANTNANSPEPISKQVTSEVANAVEKNAKSNPQNGNDVKRKNTEQAIAEAQQAEDKQTAKEAELSKEQLNNMAQSLQSFVESLNRSIEFSVDDDLKRNVITVKDALSGDVIRQIPSQEMLDLIKSLGKTTGILFNEDV